jgi:hypothetical protein
MNRGSKAAERVHVVAQFSEGIEPVEVVGGAAQIVPGQVLFKAIDSVEPGKEIVLKVIARAERDGNHRFRAQLTCGDTRLVHEETSNFVADSVSRTASRKK